MAEARGKLHLNRDSQPKRHPRQPGISALNFHPGLEILPPSRQSGDMVEVLSPVFNTANMLSLQRSVGNRASQALLSRSTPPSLQTRISTVERSLVPTSVIQREDGDLPPVGSFTPSAGITVDRVGESFTISGTLEVSGSEAQPENAGEIQQLINNTWGQQFPQGRRIRCNIRVNYRAPNARPGGGTPIIIESMTRPSYVNGSAGSRTMHLNSNEPDYLTWTPAHEFGHILGMSDHYIEGIVSRISGRFGGARNTPAEPGYEGNLMAVVGGGLESRNVRDLASETAPGYFSDDDQVRAWVNRHPSGQIASLPTASKIRMIRTLMSGWISDEDVGCIVSILQSVIDGSESARIRAAINVYDFSDLGDRMRVRIALSNLP